MPKTFSCVPLLLICAFCTKITLAQTTDSFSDKNFQNPSWIGDTTDFAIAQEMLHLNAPTSKNKVSIATLSHLSRKVSFEFKIKYEGNPSSSNHALIYLMSEKFPFTSTENQAFYLKMGGETRNNDLLSLYFFAKNKATKIWSSDKGVLLTAENTLDTEVKAVYDSQGIFEFFIKKNSAWESLGKSATPQPEIKSEYFGITINYTKSKNKSFSLDDIFIKPHAEKDTHAPQVKYLAFVSSSILKIGYSEKLDEKSALNSDHHSLASPYQIQQITYRDSSISLTISPAIQRGHFVRYTSKNIQDLSSNATTPLDTALQFYYPQKGDLFISELMVDPEPNLGKIPNVEFIEIYNSKDFRIPVQNCFMTISGKQILLSEKGYFPAKSHTMILKKKDTSLFPNLSKVATKASYTLRNDSATLKIGKGDLQYDSLFYQTNKILPTDKRNGGYSLEKHLLADCDGLENWHFSESEKGGTPGKINTTQNNPLTWKLSGISQKEISLTFSQPINENSLPKWTLNNIKQKTPPSLQNPKKHTDPQLNFPLQNPDLSKQHILQIPSITSCLKNSSGKISLSFSIPSQPKKENLYINEILYEQTEKIPEFIEIYNPSNWFFAIENISLSIKKTGSEKTNTTKLSHHYIIPPKEYLVLTSDKQALYLHFKNHNIDTSKVLQTNLSLANNGACVYISNNTNHQTIDSVCYDPSLHFNLFDPESKKGVSIEKIHENQSGINSKNWTSAIKKHGFASPTKSNSNAQEKINFEGLFALSQQQISPNANGVFDQLSIQYQNISANHFIKISIWSVEGLLVKTLVDKERLGSRGNVIWKGKGDHGQILPTGIYIVLIETYNKQGVREFIWKKSIYLHYLQGN